MTASAKFLTTSLLSFFTGVIALSGHLDPLQSNSLLGGFQDILGGILIVAPILYNLEHHSNQAKQVGKTVVTLTGSTGVVGEAVPAQ